VLQTERIIETARIDRTPSPKRHDLGPEHTDLKYARSLKLAESIPIRNEWIYKSNALELDHEMESFVNAPRTILGKGDYGTVYSIIVKVIN
jgi:hypothetical protein